MKNLLKIAIALLLVVTLATSCKSDVETETPALKFEDVNLIVGTSNPNTSGKNVNRTSSVLPFIDDITIDAVHEGSISGEYIASETFTMKDDDSGVDGFVLEDVALGNNDFYVSATTYRKSGEFEYDFVNNSSLSDVGGLLAEMRSRAPYTVFTDLVEDVVIKENSANIVSFDMEASSGRLMSLIALDQSIIDNFNTNFVVVKVIVEDVDGNTDQATKIFNTNTYDKVLRFYWSDIASTATGSKVTFEFAICDEYPIVTNTFSKSFQITTGESLGCILIVKEDEVIEDVQSFEFSFDWTETDCDDC